MDFLLGIASLVVGFALGFASRSSFHRFFHQHEHDWCSIATGERVQPELLVDCFCSGCSNLDLREHRHDLAARRARSIWAGQVDPGEGALSLPAANFDIAPGGRIVRYVKFCTPIDGVSFESAVEVRDTADLPLRTDAQMVVTRDNG